jgi:hypothetical protein
MADVVSVKPNEDALRNQNKFGRLYKYIIIIELGSCLWTE